MITNVTFFDNVDELESLTGCTSAELWEHGFNLDDMDCGFCVDSVDCFEVEQKPNDFGYLGWYWKNNIEELYWENKFPAAVHNLLNYWNGYCVGYCLAYYNGKTYVTLHHA